MTLCQCRYGNNALFVMARANAKLVVAVAFIQEQQETLHGVPLAAAEVANVRSVLAKVVTMKWNTDK